MNGDITKSVTKPMAAHVVLFRNALVIIWCAGWGSVLIDLDHITNTLLSPIAGREIHKLMFYGLLYLAGSAVSLGSGLLVAKKILRKLGL